jgi:hypothetical protein
MNHKHLFVVDADFYDVVSSALSSSVMAPPQPSLPAFSISLVSIAGMKVIVELSKMELPCAPIARPYPRLLDFRLWNDGTDLRENIFEKQAGRMRSLSDLRIKPTYNASLPTPKRRSVFYFQGSGPSRQNGFKATQK